MILFTPSLLFYAQLTYANIFSPLFVYLCCSLHLWCRYLGRGTLDVVVFGGWCNSLLRHLLILSLFLIFACRPDNVTLGQVNFLFCVLRVIELFLL